MGLLRGRMIRIGGKERNKHVPGAKAKKNNSEHEDAKGGGETTVVSKATTVKGRPKWGK